ncbi:MAG: hypothetical protein IPH16_21880 [Haliscomenobacter sp.]|nr:hypothetical protein [Haliscomenobacter sp.]MBK7476345.1 hypothetical protein [Haliscomenobacter sp.]MBK8879213.1 hypothetical protein [Haliscomenobacter sp.]
MLRSVFIYLPLTILSWNTSLSANPASVLYSDSTAQRTIFAKLSERPGPLALTIKSDFTAILQARKKPRTDFPAAVIQQNGQGPAVQWPADLSLRGKFRRMRCDFPPLRVEFKKDTLRAMGLADHNDLKLVTHCLDDPDSSKENILREYLCYRLYNILTPISYRVQLAEITYEDTQGGMPPKTRYGFFMEDFDELAQRMEGVQCDSLGLGARNTDPAQENLVYVFQYMISNADWDYRYLRNLKAVKQASSNLRLLVPYDFDHSGLVKSKYAVPRRELGQATVRERVYLGRPADAQVFKNTLAHFQENKNALLDEVRHFELLSKESRNDMLEFLRQFYASFDILRSLVVKED